MGPARPEPAYAGNPPPGGQKSDTVQARDPATLWRFLATSLFVDDKCHALWVLLATTGMRRGEALKLSCDGGTSTSKAAG